MGEVEPFLHTHMVHGNRMPLWLLPNGRGREVEPTADTYARRLMRACVDTSARAHTDERGQAHVVCVSGGGGRGE